MPSPGQGATSQLRKPLQHNPKIETVPRKLIPFSLPEFPFLHQLQQRVLSSQLCRNAEGQSPALGLRQHSLSRAVEPGVRAHTCTQTPPLSVTLNFARAAPCTRNFPGLARAQRRSLFCNRAKSTQCCQARRPREQSTGLPGSSRCSVCLSSAFPPPPWRGAVGRSAQGLRPLGRSPWLQGSCPCGGSLK